ncbi:MAG: hypothetical protein WC208_14000 [Gallionella sp.]|jgi:hypothetical protein
MTVKREKELREQMVDLIDEYFPKGDKARGRAIVMMARYFLEGFKGLKMEMKK